MSLAVSANAVNLPREDPATSGDEAAIELANAPPPEPEPPTLKQRRRSVPRKVRWPDLSVEQILAWADAHHARTGEWPTAKHAGTVFEAPREKWRNVDACLRHGLRGLPSGLSLARLLAR